MSEQWRRPDDHLKLLMDGPGSQFPVMRYDVEHASAVITEIYGDKEYYLFPSQDSPKLYPRPNQLNQSQVDQPHDLDLQRFPLMAETTPYTTILKPGQSIFIPTGWWHTVRPLTISISVSTNSFGVIELAGFHQRCLRHAGTATVQARLFHHRGCCDANDGGRADCAAWACPSVGGAGRNLPRFRGFRAGSIYASHFHLSLSR